MMGGDNSSQEDSALDNWRPAEISAGGIPKSTWRKKQNAKNPNNQPGLGELKKIKTFLAQKYKDHQIMDMFDISSETLVAIKRGCYNPIDGISLDNQSKIYKEFVHLEKKISRIFDALKFIFDNAIDSSDTSKRLAFKTIMGITAKNSAKTYDEEE